MRLMSNTPFPLGGYFSDPNAGDPVSESNFKTQVTSFTSLMETRPSFIDSFVDQTHPVSQWAGDAGYQSYSAAQAGYGSYATPVIGLPMSSTASYLNQDQQYQAFASGQYDGVLQTMVQNWKNEGFTSQDWRVGQEMNLSYMPSYAGTDSHTQSDWVSAFQHISTVLHQTAQSDGVNLNVIWNPITTNYDTVGVLQNLYPGNNYVDIIGADMYAGIYPYNPYYDWSANNGTIDGSLSQFVADPTNRLHFWTYPAATPYSLDGSTGRLLSLQDILAFAQQQGKPFAIPETGAGDSNGGHDVADDGAFPQWLAQTLTASGNQIAFVNIWDANADGNYDFSSPTANKPAEAAAWSQYFGTAAGAQSVAPAATTTPDATASTSNSAVAVPQRTGNDTLDISLSEDAYQGDAQYTVSVDGVQLGGAMTVTAAHSAGLTQDLVLNGNWGSGSHKIGITFINDRFDGTAAQDRNLYVNGVTYDGTSATPSSVKEASNGTVQFTTQTPSQTSPLTVLLSEDAYKGDAQYSISLDGAQAGIGAVTASHADGQSQALNVLGTLTAGTHDLAVSFLNDAYDGTAATDRNLYVKGVEVNGSVLPASATTLYSSGTVHFAIVVPHS